MGHPTLVQEYDDGGGPADSITNSYVAPKLIGSSDNPIDLTSDSPRTASVIEIIDLRSPPVTPPSSTQTMSYSHSPSLATQPGQVHSSSYLDLTADEPMEGLVTAGAPVPDTLTPSRLDTLRPRRGGRRVNGEQASSRGLGLAQRAGWNDQQDIPSTVTGVGKRFMTAKCGRCSTPFLKNSLGVTKHFTQMVCNSQTAPSFMNPYVKCSSVRCTLTEPVCVGCGQKPKYPPANVLSAKACCDAGRLFLIWGFLCGLDHLDVGPSGTATGHSKKKPTMSCIPTPAKPLPNPSGVGYGDSKLAPVSQGLRKAKENEAKNMQRYAQLFKLLECVLPSVSPARLTGFDRSPPVTLREMLRYSPVLGRIAEFLRSDSIEFMCTYETLYSSLFDLLKALGRHSSTASVLRDNIRILQPCHSLLSVSAADAPPSAEELRDSDTADSLLKCLQPIYRQAIRFLRHANTVSAKCARDFRTKEGASMIHLCRQIQTIPFVRETFEASADGDGARPPQQALDAEAESKESEARFATFHKENAVSDVPDNVVMAGHSWASIAEKTPNESLADGRMKRIIGEIASLQTSLPPGIFIRHGESRLDVMKVLIIGPVGTPYENGLFEFDLHCRAQYPIQPPLMLFKTTGANSSFKAFRFNPNLYENGNICLSLLGTWSGEPWRPCHSTLLQVFVSIQSMIFCPEPWYNEPGREKFGGQDEQSARHNSEIQYYTIKHAILPWIGVAPRLDQSRKPIWGDVVRQHFRAHGNDILRTARRWADNKRGKDQDLANLLGPLEKELGRIAQEEAKKD